MRRSVPLTAAGALAVAGIAMAFTAPAASARPCPEGTRAQTIYVAGQPVGVCLPYNHCDPGPCTPPPTALR